MEKHKAIDEDVRFKLLRALYLLQLINKHYYGKATINHICSRYDLSGKKWDD